MNPPQRHPFLPEGNFWPIALRMARWTRSTDHFWRWVLGRQPVLPGWDDLRDRHRGQRCFIMGGGPSLMKCDLGRLSNEITFGVNGIFLIYDKIGFEPTYYCVEDHLVYEDRWREINAQVNRSTAFFPAQFRTVDFDKTNYRFFRALYEMENYRNWPAFSQDCGRYLWIGGTVTYVCIQLAYHMGFSEVYLLGIDHNYARPAHVESKGTVWTSHGDDPNHFHPQYFGTGRRWHDPRVDRMEKAYVRAREVFHKRGRRIANATIGGRLDVFERVDYDQLFFR